MIEPLGVCGAASAAPIRSWPARGGAPPDSASAATLPEERVSLSAEGRRLARGTAAAGPELSDEEQRQVQQLKQRDAAVKAHEQAHMAAGGSLVQSGASYQFRTGPDGKSYAVGGEVKIDTSPESTPAATIRKMQQVRRAALAPVDPSATDRAVAAKAQQTETQARAQAGG